MNPSLAQFLLAGVEAFRENPNISHWNGFSEPALFSLITELTEKEVVDEAITLLKSIAKGELAPTVPPNLQEIVALLEERKKQFEETRETARESVETQIRRANEIVSRLRQEQIVYFVKTAASVPFIQKTASSVAFLPVRAFQGFIELGKEGVVKQNPQLGTTLGLIKIGVTSTVLRSAVSGLQKNYPYTQRAVIEALLRQTNLLDQLERQRPFLTSVLRLLKTQGATQFTLLTSEPQAIPPEKEKGQTVENFRFVIDLATQNVKGFERYIPQVGIRPLIQRVLRSSVKFITTPLVAPLKKLSEFLTIRLIRLPVEVPQVLGFAPTRAMEQTLLAKGLQAGFSGLGGLARGSLGILGRLGVVGAGGGAAAGGAVAIGAGTAVSTGISAGAAIALAIAAVVLLIFGTGFINLTHQSAYLLGTEISEFERKSRYLDVAKSVEPVSLDNNQLPATLSYTIKVTATEEKLTNVNVDDEIILLTDPGSRKINKTLPPYPNELQSGESFILQYTLQAQATEDFTNSIVSDTVTVTADVLSKDLKGERTQVTASVTIGVPPTFCFVFQGPWEVDEIVVTKGAIGHLARSPTFIKNLCGGNNERIIKLVRNLGNPGYRGFHEYVNPNLSIITIFKPDFVPLYPFSYVLGHESGHAYAARHDSIFNQFRRVINESFILSYPFEKSVSEDFAEMTGVYVAWRYTRINGYDIAFPQDYPQHYKFAKENIFGGVEY